MTHSNAVKPSLHAALKRSAFALAIALVATTTYAQTLGTKIDAKVDAVGTAVSDTAITAKVKTRISADALLKGSDISVTTKKGVAELTGTAPTAAASMEAEKTAAGAEGVVKVENKLVVSAPAPTLGAEIGTAVKSVGSEVSTATKTAGKAVTDSWITTKVKSELLADTATAGTHIKVTTKKGMVYLKGTASSQEEKDHAIELASKIEGVKEVDAAKLKVHAEAKAK